MRKLFLAAVAAATLASPAVASAADHFEASPGGAITATATGATINQYAWIVPGSPVASLVSRQTCDISLTGNVPTGPTPRTTGSVIDFTGGSFTNCTGSGPSPAFAAGAWTVRSRRPGPFGAIAFLNNAQIVHDWRGACTFTGNSVLSDLTMDPVDVGGTWYTSFRVTSYGGYEVNRFVAGPEAACLGDAPYVGLRGDFLISPAQTFTYVP